MAFFGFFVKNLIDLKHSVVSYHPDDPAAAQATQLRQLLERAKDTAFGKHYDFTDLLTPGGLTYARFSNRIPLFDYHQMHDAWWATQMRAPNISWPGQPNYYALSSGTTGKQSKRIPITEDMIEHFKMVSRSQAEALANFHLPASFFEGDVLGLSSSANLKSVDGHLEGEISGINISNLPDAFRSFYKPGIEIARIDDWDQRLAAIVKAAPSWNVSALAGIPSWIKEMLRAIIDQHQLRNIHELWPNLSLYTSGGVAFEPHRESFNSLLARPITIMETYLASEGFFAFNARPDTRAMQLAVDHGIFFEFIPFDERGFDETGQLLENPHVLPLMAVSEDQEYALVISSPTGAWRYLIGDTVRFTDLKRCEIVITGRTKYFLNVVGSQLSEEKLNQAILDLSKATGVDVQEFSVGGIANQDGVYHHQWVLATQDGKNPEVEVLAQQLDDLLHRANKAYRRARAQALQAPKVLSCQTEDLYNWLASEKKKGGQTKVPKVLTEEKMTHLVHFLTN